MAGKSSSSSFLTSSSLTAVFSSPSSPAFSTAASSSALRFASAAFRCSSSASSFFLSSSAASLLACIISSTYFLTRSRLPSSGLSFSRLLTRVSHSGQSMSLSRRAFVTHSSQNDVEQHGVSIASRRSLEQTGQVRSGSVGARFWMSLAERLAVRARWASQEALRKRAGQRAIPASEKSPFTTHLSGLATTKPPSAVTMMPDLTPFVAGPSPSSPVGTCGPCTSVKNDFGIPVVRLMRGRLSYAASPFVGHSWIQWPVRAKWSVVSTMT